MLRSHMAACLVATGLAAAPALAQTAPAPSGATDRPTATGSGSTTSGSSAMQPSTGATVGTSPASPSAPSTMSQSGADTSGTAGTSSGMPSLSGTASPATAASGGSAGGQIVAQQQPGQWLASKLIGTTVVGANNEPIGDVNDVLLERSGQAVAVIIGVGGFLGIGEKDVAVSFSQLEFTGRAAAGSASGPATTGTTAGSGAGASATAGAAERIVVRMTKQDLQNAPRFARADQPRDAGATGAASGPRPVSGGDRGTTSSAPASPGGSNQAPKQ